MYGAIKLAGVTFRVVRPGLCDALPALLSNKINGDVKLIRAMFAPARGKGNSTGAHFGQLPLMHNDKIPLPGHFIA